MSPVKFEYANKYFIHQFAYPLYIMIVRVELRLIENSLLDLNSVEINPYTQLSVKFFE